MARYTHKYFEELIKSKISNTDEPVEITYSEYNNIIKAFRNAEIPMNCNVNLQDYHGEINFSSLFSLDMQIDEKEYLLEYALGYISLNVSRDIAALSWVLGIYQNDNKYYLIIYDAN